MPFAGVILLQHHRHKLDQQATANRLRVCSPATSCTAWACRRPSGAAALPALQLSSWRSCARALGLVREPGCACCSAAGSAAGGLQAGEQGVAGWGGADACLCLWLGLAGPVPERTKGRGCLALHSGDAGSAAGRLTPLVTGCADVEALRPLQPHTQSSALRLISFVHCLGGWRVLGVL